MNLLDKIKLIIEARSFYVKKIYVDDLSLIWEKRQIVSLKDWVCSHYRIKRILKYCRDEKTFRWVVWYI